MLKHIIYILLVSFLFYLGCDSTSTKQLLDGDFLPDPSADTTPPNILSPADEAVVLDLIAPLSWTAKSGAEYYTVEVWYYEYEDTDDDGAVDETRTAYIPGSPFTVEEPNSSQEIALPFAGTFYWHVRASVTVSGLYSDTRSFVAMEDCLYVHFAYDPSDPDAEPDDEGRTGNIDSPYQSISHAISEAYRLGISTVRVATRGKITPAPPADEPQFAAYTEHLSFRAGVSLEGGWNSDFTGRHDFSKGFDTNENETRLEGKYFQPIVIDNIYSTTVIDGFTVRTPRAIAFRIDYCGKELMLKNCVLLTSCESPRDDETEPFIGLSINYSDPEISHCSVLTKTGGGHDQTSVRINQGNPKIVDCVIAPSSSGLFSGIVSYGIDNIGGKPLIMNNTITSADLYVMDIVNAGVGEMLSIGVKNSEAAAPVLINNIIIGGNTNLIADSPDVYSIGLGNLGGSSPILVGNTIVALNSQGQDNVTDNGNSVNTNSYGMLNVDGAAPVAINNIITSVDPDNAYHQAAVYGSGSGDVNYHFNCIYNDINGFESHPDTANYAYITPGTGNIYIDPLLDSDYTITADTGSGVKYGAYDVSGDPDDIFSDSPADTNYLKQYDAYLTDILGVTRTTGSDPGNGGSGWSMGAYEYVE